MTKNEIEVWVKRMGYIEAFVALIRSGMSHTSANGIIHGTLKGYGAHLERSLIHAMKHYPSPGMARAESEYMRHG